jgi:hypothetical protein
LPKLYCDAKFRAWTRAVFPTTLPEFQRVFLDEVAYAKYLEHLRWPHGFTCMKCGHSGEPYRFAKRTSVVLRCRVCKANVSLMADTVMKDSHAPLSVWFWGAYLVATQTPGQSALQFQRQLGLSRYETAFQMLHKLRAGMVRPERDSIGSQHPVEVDETLVGGRTRGEGRAVHHKATVVGAIEVRTRMPVEKSKKHKRVVYAGRLLLRLVPGRGAKELTEFVQENVAQGAVVRTDGWRGYDDLAKLGYTHKPLVLLPYDRVQLCTEPRGACFLTHLCDALQRRLDSPYGLIGNQPDRQGPNIRHKFNHSLRTAFIAYRISGSEERLFCVTYASADQ